MRVLIIEDEVLLQKELEMQLQKISDAVIVHRIATVKESIKWLTKYADTIDLVFMDIELADGISFEIFDFVEVNKPIIFLTAYNEYAVEAFKVNSIYYLLKPINVKDLALALNKYKKHSYNYINSINLLKGLYTKDKNQESQRLLINSGVNFIYLKYSDIAYFKTDDKYTIVVTFDNKEYLIDDSLNKLENRLPSTIFFRPTRQYLIHINSVVKASKYFNSRLKLYIKPSPGNEIIISRAKLKYFLNWMGG